MATGPANDTGIAPIRRATNDAPMLDAATERVLVASFRAGSDEALRRLLLSHLRLVRSIAKKYCGHGVSLEDLIGEGHLGLIEAARRFDPERGTRFSTYAAWWVRAYVRRFSLTNRRIVVPPSTRNARRIVSKLPPLHRELCQRRGRAVERSELAEALGVTTDEIAFVQGHLSGHDLTLSPSDDGTVMEVAGRGPDPEQTASAIEERRLNALRVQQALDCLSKREREIVQRRFLDEETATLAVLGESFGLSRERVRQIEKRARQKLRSVLQHKVA